VETKSTDWRNFLKKYNKGHLCLAGGREKRTIYIKKLFTRLMLCPNSMILIPVFGID